MPDSTLHTIFQLNIFIFDARAILGTLLEEKSQKVGLGRE